MNVQFSLEFLVIFMAIVNLITAKELSHVSKRSTVECGIPHVSVARIFSGNEVYRLEYPWKAALMKLKDDGDSAYNCGGVLIDEETIVTAAHCVHEKNKTTRLLERDLTIMLGAYNFSKKAERGRFFSSVKSINIHDKWNPSSPIFDGDIAVIKLTRSVTFDKYIRPVCLPTEKISSKVDGSVVAWGIFDDGNMVSDLPRKIDIPILGSFKCLRKSPGLIDIIWDEAFCAGKEGAGVCKGDSGSGFYVQENGKFYVRGIVSSNSAHWCSEANFALYSDILKYKSFIEEFMKSTISEDQDKMQYQNVQSQCREDRFLGYTCYIENLDVNVPNFRIRNIATQHESGKSDQDVKTIYVRESNFKYLPTFDDGFFTYIFQNARQFGIDGEKSSVSLNFHSTQDKSPIPDNIEIFAMVDFSGKIKKLPSDILANSPQLKEFWANGNEIEEIDSNFFEKKIKLTEVRINQNRIKQLPSNLLWNLKELTNFAADTNEIVTIPRDFFHYNLKLEKVFLHKNLIISLPDDLFINNKNLKLISIQFNKIKTLPPNLIANAPLLTIFYANGNEIEKIPSNFTRNNPKLKTFFN